MTHGSGRPRQAWVRTLSTLLIAVSALVAMAPHAMAHTSLISSDPPDGARLDGPPAVVTLVFDEDLLPGANSVAINLQDGTTAVSLPIEPKGSRVLIPWPTGLDSGAYQVAYRVVSADGHPVTGAIWLTIDGSDSITPAPAPAPASASGSSTSGSSSSGVSIPVLLLLVVLGGAGVIVTLVLLRRRS
ncbi:MAG: copper resistance protein CopC [Actinomycetales bacterium]